MRSLRENVSRRFVRPAALFKLRRICSTKRSTPSSRPFAIRRSIRVRPPDTAWIMFRTAGDRGEALSGAEDGGRRPVDRRDCVRLQQRWSSSAVVIFGSPNTLDQSHEVKEKLAAGLGCRHYGCRRCLRLSRNGVCAAHHGRHDLCGWRDQFDGVKAGF